MASVGDAMHVNGEMRQRVGMAIKGAKYCLHGVKRNHFKLGGSRRDLERVTLELGLGEQV